MNECATDARQEGLAVKPVGFDHPAAPLDEYCLSQLCKQAGPRTFRVAVQGGSWSQAFLTLNTSFSPVLSSLWADTYATQDLFSTGQATNSLEYYWYI